MRLTFHLRQPFEKAMVLAEAVRAGATLHGDEIEIVHGFERPGPAGLVLFGIGGMSRQIFDAYMAEGRPVVFWDKGYCRGGWYRVAVNGFQPLEYFQLEPRPDDRWRALGLEPRPYHSRPPNGAEAVLLDGASNKYCLWQGLGDWVEWGQAMVDKIRQHTSRPIIYRPRPSHNEPPKIRGAKLSTGPLELDLLRSAIVVSYGGNIGFDAALAGVPHFAIGDSIARPISATDWQYLDQPIAPAERRRLQWLADLAYCQWRLGEIANGAAWGEIRRELARGA